MVEGAGRFVVGFMVEVWKKDANYGLFEVRVSCKTRDVIVHVISDLSDFNFATALVPASACSSVLFILI